MKVLGLQDTKKLLLNGAPLLDMRSEGEYEKSALPGSFNTPLLNNSERKEVGIAYKRCGQEAAIKLGHSLVSGELKSGRVSRWQSLINANRIPALFCARGGLRSEISQQWLAEAGAYIPRIEGGYKNIRNLLLTALKSIPGELPLRVVSGHTGSAKTKLLTELAASGAAVIDLEGHANHRGSAFGGFNFQQPAQATFENAVALDLLQIKERKSEVVFIEDESRMVGGIVNPQHLFDRMKVVDLIVLDVSMEDRVQQIKEEYVDSFSGSEAALKASLLASLQSIQRALGGLRYKEARGIIEHAFDGGSHSAWIQYLLENYYDAFYERHIERNKERVVFRGSYGAVFEYCSSLGNEPQAASQSNP